jgi:translation initiation factor 2 subunit 2
MKMLNRKSVALAVITGNVFSTVMVMVAPSRWPSLPPSPPALPPPRAALAATRLLLPHGRHCSVKNTRAATHALLKEQSPIMAEEDELELSLGTKKEKKSKSKSKPASDPVVDAAARGVEAMDVSGGARPAAGTTTASSSAVKYHDYLFLLDRLYENHNDRFGVDKDKEKSRFQMPAPQVMREGSKKTVFVNFTETVKAMNREKEHVQLFISVELGTECSLAPVNDSNDKLVIKGKYLPKHIEALLRKYLTEFVESPSLAGSFDTRLERRVPVCPRCSAPASHSPLQGPHNQANERGVQQDGQQVLRMLLRLRARSSCPSHSFPGVLSRP